MEKAVSAATANREFSRLLQEVKKGKSFIVTSHGKPVARLAPVQQQDATADKAWQVLLARLESEPAMNAGSWSREELYER
jgi:prevent-host-death family protein